MKIKHLILSLIISCVAYMLLFSFVIHHPLRIGVMQKYWQHKVSYLESIDHNKIIILAGSNGRFSHRCEVLDKEFGVSCANMSIAAGLSLEYQLDIIRPYLVSGDVVYLPLEYGYLGGSETDAMHGAELPYIVAYDHAQLVSMEPKKIVKALFSFDIPFLISGLAEMYLDSVGFSKRYSLDTLTPQGDESTHNVEKGTSYKTGLESMAWKAPELKRFNALSYKASVVEGFMKWATAHNVKVVGGLPTTFNDQPIPGEMVKNMDRFYTAKGHYFLVLNNTSQYPRSYFYDTAYHLSEEYQIAHTRLIAPYLVDVLNAD